MLRAHRRLLGPRFRHALLAHEHVLSMCLIRQHVARGCHAQQRRVEQSCTPTAQMCAIALQIRSLAQDPTDCPVKN
eukprot:9763147-Lingulodinium_polyedra.AAC.1